MKLPRIPTIITFLLILAWSTACSKDDVKPVAPEPVGETEPRQFDVPFTNVPATAEIVMYEVNLWAFSQEGNFHGVRARLDQLKALGVNVIWLMPIYEIGQLKGIGSPYAVKDYKALNSSFGNLEDLRLLVKEAHSKDMAVILDWVANHTSWDHKWIQNPSWYTRDAAGNIISPAGMGWNDVADLNFGSTAMRREMIQAMKYWVLEANIDGFRCDYAEGVPNDFWKQAIDTLRKIPNRDIIMFAEAGKKELFSAGFDLIFGWNFYHKTKEVFTQNATAQNIAAANTSDYNGVADGKHILRWISNHDDNAWDNSPVTIFGSQDASLAAFVLSTTMGGVPLIYNGQEVGFAQKIPFFQNSSTKIDWNINPEVLNSYREILQFRRNSNALKYGGIQHHEHKDVVAFTRTHDSGNVIVIVNSRNAAQTYSLPEQYVNTTWNNGITREAVNLGSSINLSPYQWIILTR